MPPLRDAAPFRGYAPDEELPLGQYLGLIALYAALALAALALVPRFGELPDAPPWADLVLIALATHKLARIVTRDWVTSPLRAPFTRHESNAGAGEFTDVSRGSGWRAAIGDLLTCAYCIGPWIAGAFVVALLVAPAATRVVAAVFAVVAVADFLHELFAYLRHRNTLLAERET